MTLFKYYQDGFLPEPGTILDQPNLLIEAFDLISTVKGILDDEDLEAARNKNNKSEPASGEWVSVRD